MFCAQYIVVEQYIKGLRFLNFAVIEELCLIVDGITGDELILLYPLA
jgi:hypothetical protein